MRRQLLRAIAPIGVVVSAHLAISPAVDAVAWGPVTSTYKSEIRVEGKGSHFNDRGINAANQMTIKDRSKDKNTVYGKTTFKYNDLDVYGRPTWKTVAVK